MWELVHKGGHRYASCVVWYRRDCARVWGSRVRPLGPLTRFPPSPATQLDMQFTQKLHPFTLHTSTQLTQHRTAMSTDERLKSRGRARLSRCSQKSWHASAAAVSMILGSGSCASEQCRASSFVSQTSISRWARFVFGSKGHDPERHGLESRCSLLLGPLPSAFADAWLWERYRQRANELQRRERKAPSKVTHKASKQLQKNCIR